MAARPDGTITLRFDKANLTVGEDDTDIRTGLSGVVRSGNDLWLACDEGCRVERLSLGAATTFGSHDTFALHDLLSMPASKKNEADIEGMDVDDGYLWVVGSHSVKRKKAKPADTPEETATRLASTKRDGNRHLLARLPIKGSALQKSAGSKTAAILDATPESSALLDAIVSADDPEGADEHLAAFVPIAGKDNGFDVEGLAVRNNRALIGLRGPVLREWCCILECALEADAGRLELRPGNGGRLYRKHFLRLNGLGVRDLVIVDDDLLILVGVSMAHDGPAAVWRWRGGARKDAAVDMSRVERVLELPVREGADRPEGLALFESGDPVRLLVVYDTPSKDRLTADGAVTADVFRI